LGSIAREPTLGAFAEAVKSFYAAERLPTAFLETLAPLRPELETLREERAQR